jgi:hypothetical protein
VAQNATDVSVSDTRMRGGLLGKLVFARIMIFADVSSDSYFATDVSSTFKFRVQFLVQFLFQFLFQFRLVFVAIHD